MYVVGSVGHPGQGLLHDPVNAMTIDLRHGMHLHPRLLQPLLLSSVQTTDPNQGDIRGVHLRRRTSHAGELTRAIAEERRQRHAVNVARGRRLWSIDVTVSIDPEEAHTLTLAVRVRRDSGDGTHGYRVIAAEHQ